MNSKNMMAGALGVLAAAGIATAANADGDSAALEDRVAIEQLAYCYAQGADAIGNGKVEADPLAAGLKIYKNCFAETATFAVWPVGMPFNQLKFPDRTGDMPPAFVIEGPEAFAGMVNGAFRGAGGGDGYDFVQHGMTNIEIDVQGDTAKMNAYLASVHMIHGAPGEPTRCRQQANGTYSMNVERIDGKWMVTSLDLAQIAYDTVISNGKGC